MKRILSIALLALGMLPMKAQGTAYKITGTVPDGISKVYLAVMPDGEAVDSVIVTDGKFELDGKLKLNDILLVSTGDYYFPMFNDGTPVKVDLAAGTMEGSELNKKVFAYDAELTEFGNEAGKTFAEYRAAAADTSAAGKAKTAALMAQCQRLQNEYFARQLDIVKANTGNLIPALYLSQLYYVLDYDVLKELLPETAPYYNHPALAHAKTQLKALGKRRPGSMFTDLTMNDTDGRQRRLSEWCGKGNYVLVDFWASWCGPCRQEMPTVVANYAKYHPKGFEVVGVSFDNNGEAWKNAIEKLGMEWPNISDLKGWESEGAAAYGINAIPANVLLDGEGKIVAADLRGSALGEKLKEVYGF